MARFQEVYEQYGKAVYRFLLHAYGGLKLKEIAVSYGKQEVWARVTYYRAKQMIVEEVSE